MPVLAAAMAVSGLIGLVAPPQTASPGTPAAPAPSSPETAPSRSVFPTPTPAPTAAAPVAAPAPAPSADEFVDKVANLDPRTRETLACIRHYESRGRYWVRNGPYGGAYQFSYTTWRSVGGSGDPAEASPAEQDYRAALLLERRGLQPWPFPSKKCR